MSDLLAELKESWESYKVTERHGLEFGRVCHELHNEYVTKGKREAGKGVQAICKNWTYPAAPSIGGENATWILRG